MRRFRFNLEKILSLRIIEEEQVRAEFKSALAAVAGIEGEIANMEGCRRDAEGVLREVRGQTPMDVRGILVYEAGLGRLAVEIQRARGKLKAAEEAAEEVRARLEEATRKRESLEKMKSKHRKRYEADANAEERKALDEVAVTRFLRQDGNEGRDHVRRS
jgi:flagellar FliJ protein